MYGYKTWATTKYLLSHLDAFDMWALHKILRIPFRHVSNAEVRRTTGCSPLSHLVTNRRLRLFGHIARSSSREDHHPALAAAIRQVPPDWKRPVGRPSHTVPCSWGRPWPSEFWPRDCLEKGHYSRWMATLLWTQQRFCGVRSERRKACTLGFSEAVHWVPEPASTVIPTLARIRGPGALKPDSSDLSQI